MLMKLPLPVCQLRSSQWRNGLSPREPCSKACKKSQICRKNKDEGIHLESIGIIGMSLVRPVACTASEGPK